jgi:hypothetical protein
MINTAILILDSNRWRRPRVAFITLYFKPNKKVLNDTMIHNNSHVACSTSYQKINGIMLFCRNEIISSSAIDATGWCYTGLF